jgi:hypothetical protein
VVELETHRVKLATESPITAAMVTATKEKAVFRGLGRSEALQWDSARARRQGETGVTVNWIGKQQ